MAPAPPAEWSFLTNHGQVLVHIARDPDARLREIGDAVGITERAAHRIVSELAEAGYISR
jgi:DNA-binding MarR family transcriptional regulator